MVVAKDKGLGGVVAIVGERSDALGYLRRHCEEVCKADAAIQSSVSVSRVAGWIAASRGSSQ